MASCLSIPLRPKIRLSNDGVTFPALRCHGIAQFSSVLRASERVETCRGLAAKIGITHAIAPQKEVGIDLGLKDIAVTSDAERLEAGRFYRRIEPQIAQAQRRSHKRQAKRLHRRAASRRRDALHKFGRKIVDQYQNIVAGDVSSLQLAKTRMAKSVLDAGWGMLKMQLQYKGQQAGRSVRVVNERNTTRVCSSCGASTGPSGPGQLVVRQWECTDCGAVHDRDVNAAMNILKVGSRCRTSVSGNEPDPICAVEPGISPLRDMECAQRIAA
jgi:putative transposase